MTVRIGGNIIAGNHASTLPDQIGQSGKFLTTNGIDLSWADIPTELPDQAGQSGKYLTTNGSSTSWNTVTVPTIDQIYDSTSTNAQSGIAIAGAGFQTAGDVSTSINSIESLTKISMVSLTYDSTIALATNTAYTLTLAGDITFTLPNPTAGKLNQIEIQLYMDSVYSLTLGTSYYFGGSAPDMSTAGYYSIIYEYDWLQSQWIVGAMKKASA